MEKWLLPSIAIFGACTHVPPKPTSLSIADCQYLSKESQDVVDVTACAEVDAKDQITFHSAFLQQLTRSPSHGPHCVQVKRGSSWTPYYVLANGQNRPTLSLDNGCDDFAEGLARTPVAGRIGFMNESLTIVVEPKYEWAFPFDQGKARVCNQISWVQDGESKSMASGSCGSINKTGELNSPLQAIKK